MDQFNKISLNNFEFTYQDDGEWIWKALPFKTKSVEKPHLKVIDQIEDQYHKLFDSMLVGITKDITRYLKG